MVLRSRSEGVEVGRALLLLTIMALTPGMPLAPGEAWGQGIPPGWLGIELEVAPSGVGLEVRGVFEGGPAQSAGIRPGDRILRIEGADATEAELDRLVRSLRAGTRVGLVLDREGEALEITVQAEPRPFSTGVGPQWRTPDRFVVPWGPDRSRVLIRERPPAPFIAGQRVVGGAELVTLSAALGSYFQVDRGVLVLEVLEGTPAALAGLEAGDVIVQVNGEEVSTIVEVRRALARGYRSPPVAVQVVREGEERVLNFGG
jgi:serine protease Do